MKTLNQLRDEAHEIAKSKGFHDSGRIDIPGCLMLIVSELAEAMEADRKGRSANLDKYYKGIAYGDCFETYVKDTFEDELADTVIRVLDLCGALNIDIEKHVELKMKYNKSRERMHGKKY